MSIFAPLVSTLSYVERTSDFTTASGTAVQVTTLTTGSIQVPGTRIQIIAFVPFWEVSGLSSVEMSIWDGTVASGTLLNRSSMTQTLTTYRANPFVMWVGTPAAGSKTYNVGVFSSAASSITGKMASTSPGFIMVNSIPG